MAQGVHSGEGNPRIGEFLKKLDLTSFLTRLPMHERAAQGLAGEGTPQITEEAGTKLGLCRDQVLNPLLDAGLAEMTTPDKPRSSKQRYRLTSKGGQVLEDLEEIG